MGQVIQFIPKADLERARLIREARAIYDSIFPPTDAVGEQSHGRPGRVRSYLLSFTGESARSVAKTNE
jgi:hypothetical protein